MFRSTGAGGFIPPQKRGFFVVVIFALLVKVWFEKRRTNTEYKFACPAFRTKLFFLYCGLNSP